MKVHMLIPWMIDSPSTSLFYHLSEQRTQIIRYAVLYTLGREARRRDSAQQPSPLQGRFIYASLCWESQVEGEGEEEGRYYSILDTVNEPMRSVTMPQIWSTASRHPVPHTSFPIDCSTWDDILQSSLMSVSSFSPTLQLLEGVFFRIQIRRRKIEVGLYLKI